MMMRTLLIAIGLLTLSFYNYAIDVTVIQFDKEFHDFGKVLERKGPVSVTFNFKNIGKTTFQIEEIETSCGCTSYDYTKTPVKKGKTGYIKVTFDPAGRKGVFSKTVVVKGNMQKDIYLRIGGTVVAAPKTRLDEYDVALGNLRVKRTRILLGEVYNDKLDTVRVSFYNQSGRPIRISGMESPRHIMSDYFPIEVPPRDYWDVEFYYSAYMKGDLGYVFDKINFITDDVEMPKKEMIVVANIVEDFERMTEEEFQNTARIKLSAYEYDFGKVEEGKILTRELTMRNEGKSKLVIYDLKTNCGCTATTLGKRKLDPGEEVKFKVVFHTKNRTGEQLKKVTILTNDPTNKKIEFLVKAYVISKS